MAPIQSKNVPSYTSDFTIVYNDIRFKLKAGRVADGQTCGDYEDPPAGVVCGGTGNLFKMRALIATYVDGEKVKFPVSTNAKIVPCIQTLKAVEGVVCIDLEGEEWGVVPPLLAGYTPVNTVYTLPTKEKSDKTTGSFDYTSDISGLIGDKFAIEENPTEISSKLLGCLAARRDKDKCVLGAGIKARHVIAIANGSYEDKPAGILGGAIIRKGKVSLLANVLDCIRAVGDVTLCVGYKGESAKNVHLLVPDA